MFELSFTISAGRGNPGVTGNDIRKNLQISFVEHYPNNLGLKFALKMRNNFLVPSPDNWVKKLHGKNGLPRDLFTLYLFLSFFDPLHVFTIPSATGIINNTTFKNIQT